ncbi:hypothetical protein M3640_21085, partial [Bacillus velezensis]|nr:hypothetical protein [Bacillus velezensis]
RMRTRGRSNARRFARCFSTHGKDARRIERPDGRTENDVMNDQTGLHGLHREAMFGFVLDRS